MSRSPAVGRFDGLPEDLMLDCKKAIQNNNPDWCIDILLGYTKSLQREVEHLNNEIDNCYWDMAREDI